MTLLIPSIETPAVLIEKSILERNLTAMQNMAAVRGVLLRPHIKTHKIPELAKMQLKLGATGIAVAKIGEAEIFCAAGVKDIQIANIIVGATKIARLKKLSKKCRLTVAVDSIDNAQELSRAFISEKTPLDVLIKINCGLNRCGVDKFEDLSTLMRLSGELNGIKIIGIMTHAGHAYAAANRKEIEEIGLNEGGMLVDYADRLRKIGYKIDIISAGSTPTARYCSKIKGITELRVGNYIFNDMTQVALGTVPLKNCALSILATVISVPSNNRAIIDAGSKSLALDKGAHGTDILVGHGKIIGTDDYIARLSEEHGIIDDPKRKYRVGEKIRIIPNHACAAMNLFDSAYLVDRGKIVRQYKISARGKTS
jgi:D-serine deaminase-like pyridoxal phosphate-dependent protein